MPIKGSVGAGGVNTAADVRVIQAVFIWIIFPVGVLAMSSNNVFLNWEWHASRLPDQKILVRVESVVAKKASALGIDSSPSFAGSLPDPVVVEGVIQRGSEILASKRLIVTLPRLELNDVSTGDFAVLGIIGDEICICLTGVDSDDVDPDTISCPMD